MKGEATALSVHAQRCQAHYFSTTPRILNKANGESGVLNNFIFYRKIKISSHVELIKIVGVWMELEGAL